MIGSIVKVIVDRPLGIYHTKHKNMYYSVIMDTFQILLHLMEKNKMHIFLVWINLLKSLLEK